MPHAVDLLVNRRVFLDVGVGPRHICFGLVVVVIRNEVLDRIVGKQVAHLAVKLGSQSFVGSEDEGRALTLGNDVRHREGFARPGDPEQDLILLALTDARHEGLDGGRLIAGWFEI